MKSKKQMIRVGLICFLALVLLIVGLSISNSGASKKESSDAKTKEEVKPEKVVLFLTDKIEKAEISFYPVNSKEEIVSVVSSDEKILKVDDNYNVEALKEGTATITVTTASGLSNSTEVEAYIAVKELKLNKSSLSLTVGSSETLKTTITPSNATYKKITWESDDTSVVSVSSGKLKAQSEGTATVTATTEDGLSAKCQVTVKPKPISFSGSGNKVIKNVNIPAGNYKVTMTNSGSHNFAIWFYADANDEYGELLVNEIGKYSGSTITRDGYSAATKNGLLEVTSSGKWTIKFEPVSGSISKSVSGKGDKVTGMFVGDGSRMVVTLKNSGAHNFAVWVYDEYGGRDLLANEIGSYNGQATFKTESGIKYYYVVTSSGNWTISWE